MIIQFTQFAAFTHSVQVITHFITHCKHHLLLFNTYFTLDSLSQRKAANKTKLKKSNSPYNYTQTKLLTHRKIDDFADETTPKLLIHFEDTRLCKTDKNEIQLK